MTTLRAFDDLPAGLVHELADAGLDPLDVHAHVVAALGEDLPGGVAVTSRATIPAYALADADFQLAGGALHDDGALGDLTDPDLARGGLRLDVGMRPVDHDVTTGGADADVTGGIADQAGP